MNEEQFALAVAMEKYEAESDPLSGFEWANEKQRELYRAVSQGIEGSHCAANQAAKTYGGAAYLVAFSQQRESLDGVMIPALGRAITGRVLVLSYDQQIESSQAAIMHWIGRWPHEPVWMDRGRGIMSAIKIRTISGRWSIIHFTSQANSNAESIRGQREDCCWPDEPPHEDFLRESRKNARFRWITWTPLARHDWEPLDKDFALAQGHIHNGRLEIITSVYENKFLPRWRIRELELAYENDPFKDARLYGLKQDIEDLSPWGNKGHARLQVLSTQCVSGKIVEAQVSTRGGDVRFCRLEQWFPWEMGEQYVLMADPSRGIEGEDPSGFLIVSRMEPRLVLRTNDYYDAYELGLLAAHCGESYGMAWCDFDSTGGYGEAFSLGLAQYRSNKCRHGYPRISKETYSVAPGKTDSRLGLNINAGSRADIISAVRSWLSKPDSCKVWSREVIRCLLDVRVKKGTTKIEAPDGFHDEDMICFGRLLQLIESLPMQREQHPAPSGPRQAFQRSFGRDVLGKVYREASRKAPRPVDKWR